ncbi:hypothetical protein WN55_04006 [Dufourea novaeangliae]|uniref:Uncharacterized protein n=1 Tax=Dufourea novaeangliae TaxID=178035 RepID=A0A154PME5_DUFNO|nr:hypothetical protein WN55_04006 [Dufourea novaeangliae]
MNRKSSIIIPSPGFKIRAHSLGQYAPLSSVRIITGNHRGEERKFGKFLRARRIDTLPLQEIVHRSTGRKEWRGRR